MGNTDAMDAQLGTQFGALADGLVKVVSVARTLAESGRPVDLDGLDRHIGLLCAKALDLPPEVGRTQRVRLITLRDEVERLTAALRQAAPEQPIPPVKTSRAYRTTN